MKTVKQIADEIGVTRQAIHLKIQKEPLSSALQPYLTKNGKALYIEDIGVKLICSEFLSSVKEKPLTNDLTTTNTLISLLQSELNEKNTQLHVKDKQLEKKDEQIAELNERLKDTTTALVATQQTAATAQALHAGTLQQQITTTENPTDELKINSNELKRDPFGVFETMNDKDLEVAYWEYLYRHPEKKKRGIFSIFKKE